MLWFKKRNRSKSLNNPPAKRNIKKRDSERIKCELPIVFANHETGEIFKGSAFNYSQRGLYVEVDDYCPIVGKGALIYMTEYSPKAEGPNDLKKYYVQVKWTRQLSETEYPNQYGIGVKHCSGIDEFVRLFA
jgi:hypothetical protein